MTSLAVAVMAHPKREAAANQLADHLGADIAWDDKQDRWDTGKRAWLLAASHDAQWSAVAQDDVLVSRNLVAGLKQALEYVPDRAIVSPVILQKSRCCEHRFDTAIATARETGASWLRTRGMTFGQMIIVPTATISAMLKHGDRLHKIEDYGTRSTRYYRAQGYRSYYTWPSLIDHDDVPSLIGNPDGRVAYEFIGEDADARGFDWSGPVIDAFTASPAERRARRLQR